MGNSVDELTSLIFHGCSDEELIHTNFRVNLVSGAERSKTRDLDGVDSRMSGFFAQADNHEVHIKKTIAFEKRQSV